MREANTTFLVVMKAASNKYRAIVESKLSITLSGVQKFLTSISDETKYLLTNMIRLVQKKIHETKTEELRESYLSLSNSGMYIYNPIFFIYMVKEQVTRLSPLWTLFHPCFFLFPRLHIFQLSSKDIVFIAMHIAYNSIIF